MTFTPAVPDPPELDHVLWKDFQHVEWAFDVGANAGQTLRRIRAFSTWVIAFEPSVESYDYLRTHFEPRHGFISYNRAVSSKNGRVDLVAAPGKIETGQLVTAGTPGMEWSDSVGDGEVRSVSCVTLDYFAQAMGWWPKFLKIDVEGHELEVLLGATEVLKRARPEMLIEVHSEALGESILSLLQDDFLIDLVRHPHYVPGSTLWKTHFWLRCFPTQNSI